MNDLAHTYLDAAIDDQSQLQTWSEVGAPIDSKTPLPVLLVCLVTLLLAVFAATGTRLWANWQSSQSLTQYTQTLLQRSVLITHAKPGAVTQKIRLPTSLRGATEAAVYARSTGYLTTWHKDIGDLVNKGELLAVIDTPELEQELAQVTAQREQMQARLHLAQQTLTRWEHLGARNGAVTEQALAEKRSLLQQANADGNIF